MPRVARFTLTSLTDLARQLIYAPAETRAKQMDAAESLAAELEMDQLYPEDFVIYRITGYKPQIENPALLVGEALAGDLVNFVQLLSDGLEVPPDYRSRCALEMHEVATRLNVSSKTLLRYRKQGLICHYVTFSPDDKRLACFEDSLARFVSGHQSRVEKAHSYNRIDETGVQKMIDEARSLRLERQMSLNEAALEIARRHHRAHETVRMLLRKHDRRSDEPIFTDRGPLTEREGRVLHRAWRWGIPVSQMAERYGRTVTTIHRVINRRRGALLQSLDLHAIKLPTFDRDDAAEVILAVKHVSEELNRLLPQRDALQLLEAAKKPRRQPDAEIALLAAYNFLKRRAALGIKSFREWPGSTELDAVETDLRWASRIKCRLVSMGLPTAIARIEQHLHRPLIEQSTDRIIAAIDTAATIVSRAIETIDPAKGQLARIVAYASDRALAQEQQLIHLPGRATARHTAGSIVINDPFADLSPWDRFIEPRQELQTLVDRLTDDRVRVLLRMRYGFDGTHPRTIRELSQHDDTTPITVARMISRAESQLLSLLRSGKEKPAGK